MSIYTLTTFILVLIGMLVTVSNPTDHIVKDKFENKDSKLKGEFLCEICDSYIKNEKTKHCG